MDLRVTSSLFSLSSIPSRILIEILEGRFDYRFRSVFWTFHLDVLKIAANAESGARLTELFLLIWVNLERPRVNLDLDIS